MITNEHISIFKKWQSDWCTFAKDVLKVILDDEQKKILSSIQKNKMVSVCSGTARGKDFIAAVAALCFMYLTPKFNSNGKLIENTKVAMTAPTDRQVGNIMYPEITRLFKSAQVLPGRLVSHDIRTDYDEWFLTGFKASKDNTEAWSGFHAVNTMFIITEASGLDNKIFEAIEGNLQGNSRLLIVFNPNVSIGYAASSQRSPRFNKFRLDSLTSPNVIQKKIVIPGQVDYDWINDKVKSWCVKISEKEFSKDEGDFEFEGSFYRPNDLFRIKVRGMFPKTSEDNLIPLTWIETANENWLKSVPPNTGIELNLGVDIAGMGTDNSVICPRRDNYVYEIESYSGNGKAEHMKVAGIVANRLTSEANVNAYIDTIGEGAGVYSRLVELGYTNAYSCKFSENANGLKDKTGVYEFENMRAYLFWSLRDWLNPAFDNKPCLPIDDELLQEATEIRFKFKSNGKIIIEPKEDVKKRLKRSPDKLDSLANTFYPDRNNYEIIEKAYEKASRYL